jgi:hypothetical protein
VAYWNLHERQLRRNQDTTKVSLSSGGPLRVMHFSGFAVPSNGKISKHTSRRYEAETEQILDIMISNYENLLLKSSSQLKHLSADLGFSNKPLIQRMQIAADYWNEPSLEVPPQRFIDRLYNRLQRFFRYKNLS